MDFGDVRKSFQILLFYNALTEKHLSNITESIYQT